jgi:hypothetical protein
VAKRKHPKSIIAEEYCLVDGQGNTRASLRTAANGAVVFDLSGDDRLARLSLQVGTDGKASIFLLRKNGRISLSLASMEDGSAAISINNQDGTKAFIAQVILGHSAQVELYDATGNPVRTLP